jgi:hypothetical protein
MMNDAFAETVLDILASLEFDDEEGAQGAQGGWKGNA